MNTQTDHEFVGTTINHEREPHCCGCFVIHWNAGEPIAVCNECNHTVDLLVALAATGEVPGGSGELGALRKALALAVQQNSHDMLMTGEEIRQCEAALAATGKQQVGEVVVTRDEDDEIVLVSRQDEEGRILSVIAQTTHAGGRVGEVQGSREQFEAWAEIQTERGDDGEYVSMPTRLCWSAWKAALASRQPVGQDAVAWMVFWSSMFLAKPELTYDRAYIAEIRALENPPRIENLYAAPPAQPPSPIATRKLEELAAQGYITNGVAIFNPATGQRGLVDNLGYVGWQGAQGVDLGQFREAVQHYYHRMSHNCNPTKMAEAQRLLTLIDGRDAGAGVGS